MCLYLEMVYPRLNGFSLSERCEKAQRARETILQTNRRPPRSHQHIESTDVFLSENRRAAYAADGRRCVQDSDVGGQGAVQR